MTHAPRPQKCPGMRRTPRALEVCGQRHTCMRHSIATDPQQPPHEPRFPMNGADCPDYTTWRD